MSIENLQRSHRHLLMAWFVTVFLVSVAWWWFATTPVPVSPPLMTIGPIVTGETALCPNDVLTHTYTKTVKEPGVYLFDVAVWRTDPPPAIIIFFDSRRVVAPGPMSWEITREWRIPPTYRNPRTDKIVEWQPGHYSRTVAVTAVGRDTRPSTANIPFEIRDDCPPLPLEPTP